MQSSYQSVPQEADESYDRHFERYHDDDGSESSGGFGSGYNNYRPPSGSLKGKMESKYWHTKQAVMQKLGKDQDVHVVAGDAEVDARLEAFRHIQKTCIDLLKAIEIYQNRIFALSQDENEMGRFLREQGSQDKSKAGKMMIAVGKAQSYTAQQRLSLRTPLVRLYQEIETFRYRAISDTALTVGRMEGSRTDYRASLLWMANISKELNPEEWKRLDKFREVQSQVKKVKKKFEKNKLDVMQKVDLLSASRCNLLSSTLAAYQQAMLKFWENTSKSMNQVAEQFKGYPSYQFQMLKSLNPLMDAGDKTADIKEIKLDQETHVEKKDTEKAEEVNEQSEQQQNEDDDDTLICLDNSPIHGKSEGADSAQNNGKSLIETDLLGDELGKEDGGPSSYIDLLGGDDALQSPRRGSGTATDDLLGVFDEHRSSSNGTTGLLNMDPPSYEAAQDLMGVKGPRNLQSGLDNVPSTGNQQSTALSADDLLFGSPMHEPMTKSDIELLSDILGNSASSSHALVDSNSFSSQWREMFGDSPQPQPAATGIDSSHPGYLPSDLMDSMMDLDPFGGHPAAGAGSTSLGPSLFGTKQAGAMKAHERGSAPSQSRSQGPQSGKQDKLKGKKGATDLSAWFNLFSDLDPLANPDAIGQGKKTEEERTC